MGHDNIVRAETIEAVVCSICRTLHIVDAETYVSVCGNIYVGENGGIVGNNLDETGKVKRTAVFCRTEKCFGEVIKSTHKDR